MSNTITTTKTTNGVKLFADFYIALLPKWEKKAEGYKKLAIAANNMYLPNSAKTLEARAQKFWDKANTILSLLERNPKGKGSRTLRKAYNLYNEVARSVHDQVKATVYNVVTRPTQGMRGLWGKPRHRAQAAAIVKADKLGKEAYKCLLCACMTHDDAHIRLVGKNKLSIEVCSDRYLKGYSTRKFIIPKTYNVLTLLYNRTNQREWWGDARTLFMSESFETRKPLPTI